VNAPAASINSNNVVARAGQVHRAPLANVVPMTLDALQRLSGSAVANAIETFDVRLRNEGFADGSVLWLFDELPPAVGYAVTARVRCSTPPPVGHVYHDNTDWWTYITSVPAPRFVVVQDVDEQRGLGAFIGEVHANILRALSCVGYATNGSVRDHAALHAMGFPCFAASRSVSHAFAHIVDFGQPVEIGGLPVTTGDLLFGDRDGLQSVPPELVDRLPDVAARMVAQEQDVIRLCQSPQFSIDSLRQLVRSLG
jgi:regulator of RNase E activity RraA